MNPYFRYINHRSSSVCSSLFRHFLSPCWINFIAVGDHCWLHNLLIDMKLADSLADPVGRDAAYDHPTACQHSWKPDSYMFGLKSIQNPWRERRAQSEVLIDLPSINKPQQINLPACPVQAGFLAWHSLKIMSLSLWAWMWSCTWPCFRQLGYEKCIALDPSSTTAQLCSIMQVIGWFILFIMGKLLLFIWRRLVVSNRLWISFHVW